MFKWLRKEIALRYMSKYRLVITDLQGIVTINQSLDQVVLMTDHHLGNYNVFGKDTCLDGSQLKLFVFKSF